MKREHRKRAFFEDEEDAPEKAAYERQGYASTYQNSYTNKGIMNDGARGLLSTYVGKIHS